MDLIGRAQGYIEAAAGCPPARNGVAAEMFVRISDAPVMFGAIRVLAGCRARVARPPELFDESLALTVRFEQKEGPPFFRSDDVHNIFIQQSLINRLESGLNWWVALSLA